MEQLSLTFDPCPCGPAVPASVMEWSGFKADFTYHDWCERFYVGTTQPDGSIKPCECPLHGARGARARRSG
jgi:hypothetical protein